MNYRHIYHAGNFADVVKHSVLVLLLQKLIEKDKPFCVLDTHAGIGQYPLQSQPAQKTGEAQLGIVQLMQQENLSPLLTPYLDCVRRFNTHSQDGLPVHHYPGSPCITQTLLREHDRLLANEMQPDDARLLDKEMRRCHNVKVFKEDGYTWLNAQLPPLEKRGLVLIDPPFETDNELKKIAKQLRQSLPKFAHGIYAVWYPIKAYHVIQHFHRSLKDATQKEILFAELCIHPCTDPTRLNGCGVAIINPPWQLDEKLKKIMPQFLDCFSKKGYGKWQVWLEK